VARSKAITRSPKLHEQVGERLREEILKGSFPAGQRLIETDLAARYGVSRTPVREALLQLAREGSLVVRGHGFAVRLDNRRDIDDRLEVRLLLDAQVARHAALERDERAVRELRAALDRARRAHEEGRSGAFVRHHQAVRDQIRAMCGNLLLGRYAAMLDESFALVRGRLHEAAENRALTLASDERLADAIEAGDPERAEREVRVFVELVRDFYTHAADCG
jgi:DNA-binding GntR family transcriptional regulator